MSNNFFQKHLRPALKAGFWVGLASAHVDIIYKLIRQNFEWFELYLIPLYSTLIFSILFALLAFFAWVTAKLTSATISDVRVRNLYAACGVSLGFFHVALSVFFTICENSPLAYTSIPLFGNLFIGICACAILGRALLFQEGPALSIPHFFNRGIKRKFVDGYSFGWFVFMGASLLMDLLLIHYQPQLVSKPRVKDRPNIILITLDTLRADHLPIYGYSRNTAPQITKIAERSVVFEHVTSPSSWTLPSHASLFTGQNPTEHGATARHQKLETQATTLAELLLQEGYITSGLVGGFFSKGRFGLSQGFQFYHDRLDYIDWVVSVEAGNVRKLISLLSQKFHDFLFQSDCLRTAEEINRDVFKWLDSHKEQRFFLFLNYFDVHDPYVLGEPFEPLLSELGQDDEALEEFVYTVGLKEEYRYNWMDVDPQLKADIISRYDGEIRYLDHHLGHLMQKLQALGLTENTAVIITADHGEEFFDHGGTLHSHTLFQEIIHVPLIVHFPKMFSPKRVSQRVGSIDLFATLLELAGMDEVSSPSSQSLVPLLKGQPGFQERPILSEYWGRPKEAEVSLQAVTHGQLKLMGSEKDQRRTPRALFELGSDPEEKQNLLPKESEIPRSLGQYLHPSMR